MVGGLGLDLHSSVENEWLCLAFLRALGLDVATATIATFTDAHGPVRALVVDRFDRQWRRDGDGREWIARLPQEDFCQATATPSERKYESDGGPGIAACLDVLARGMRAEADTMTFTLAQLAFWLLAAVDGHAKNFSIFLRRDGHTMTPLYDVLSAWPIIGARAGTLPRQRVRLAMALRGTSVHYELSRIHARHWHALAGRLAARDAWMRMVTLVEGADAAMATVESALPNAFPLDVCEAIAAGVRDQRRRFLAEVVAGGRSSP
jgi:serine/threonine-protein kinase HipA